MYGNDRYDNDRRYNNGYGFDTRMRDEQIRQINRDFDWRVQQIERDRYLRGRDKRRQVRMLEIQRQQQIQQVNERYYRSNNSPYARNNRRW